MIASCPNLSQGEGVVSPLLVVVDCYVETLTTSSYGALFGPGSGFTSVLTAMLTLVVALYGYQLMFGRMALSISSALPKVALIGVVLTFATNWAAYQTVVYNLLTQGPAELAGRMLGQAIGAGRQDATADVAERLDLVFLRLTEAAQAWEEAIPDTNTGQQNSNQNAASTNTTDPGQNTAAQAAQTLQNSQAGGLESLGSKLLLASAVLFVLASGGLLVVAKIFLGVLLSIGPIFIVLALFGATRGLFDGWLRTSLTFAMAPMIIMILSTATMTVLEDTILELVIAQRSGIFELPPVLTIFIATLIFTAMMALVLRLSASLTASWMPSRSISRFTSLPNFFSNVSAPALAASGPLGVTNTILANSSAEKNMRMAALLTAIGPNSANLATANQARLNFATGEQSRTAIVPTAAVLPTTINNQNSGTGRQLGQTYQGMARNARASRAGGWR